MCYTALVDGLCAAQKKKGCQEACLSLARVCENIEREMQVKSINFA